MFSVFIAFFRIDCEEEIKSLAPIWDRIQFLILRETGFSRSCLVLFSATYITMIQCIIIEISIVPLGFFSQPPPLTHTHAHTHQGGLKSCAAEGLIFSNKCKNTPTNFLLKSNTILMRHTWCKVKITHQKNSNFGLQNHKNRV